jgi:hypothetical protein
MSVQAEAMPDPILSARLPLIENISQTFDKLPPINLFRAAANARTLYAPNPEHQRAKLVCLTAKAMRILRQLSEIQILWANRISSTATAADIRSTLKTMGKFVAQLERDESNQ